jgi:Rrf2 family transcriptional regulator, iron-sulfur cluster assembly transcription factor
MLSRTVGYAVRAVIVLARHGNAPVSADTIAAIVGAPRNYLSKTLTVLARRGIVTGTRGPGGGFSLAISPDVLTVADVVDAFSDTVASGARCLIRDAACDPAHPCAAHRRWAQIAFDAREPLLRTVIRELSGHEDDMHDAPEQHATYALRTMATP